MSYKTKDNPYTPGSWDWIQYENKKAWERKQEEQTEIPLPPGDTATRNPVDITPVTYTPDSEKMNREIERKEIRKMKQYFNSGLGTVSENSSKHELLNADHFVEITDGNEKHYGGDQIWFEGEDYVNINGITYPGNLIAKGGCANSAAVNTMIYMGVVPFDGTKKRYQEIAKDMLNYFSPIIISGYYYIPDYPIKEREQGNRATFDWGIPLGVPSLKAYADGVVSFAEDHGVSLKANIANRKTSYEDAVAFIEEGLDKDKPVAMLILFNEKMKNVPVSNNKTQDFKPHWMIITGIERDPNTDEVHIDIASWGDRFAPFSVPFDDVWNHTWGNKGLVYFEEAE